METGLAKYYTSQTPATAYIDSKSGLQVVLSKLDKVFGEFPGVLHSAKGIEGTLYYNRLPATPSMYEIKIVQDGNEDFVQISFYDNQGDKPYAVFIAKVSADVAQSVATNYQASGEGRWWDGILATEPDVIFAGAQTLTFTEILGKFYKNNVPASALVINNPATKALRLEVPELGKEFSDGEYIGKDPEGVLYYNDVKDFKYSSYHITAVTVTVQDGTNSITTKFMRIKFFVDKEQDCYAEFVAKDPAGVAANLGTNGLTKKGDWSNLDIGCATAVITKSANASTITVKARSIHKKATIQLSSTDDASLIAQAIDVKGNLYFKDTSTIDTGIFANWNNDRVVFYHDNDYSTDFTAYFIPFESSKGELGVQVADTKILKDVKWTK
ncbi:hypothetical protein B0H16DRAFT_1599978 [Mycena metata]|uniref:Uncharacterized protein n=1 Tax=Mycena metata TaxID=1033252 RepID=A0AAD7HKC2_9AGAR|nr:hypothetical protein B0H16DRAFT_1599978 [Mycena metata]